MADQIEILGIGNAIVDIIVRAGDDLLREWDMRPGAMSLIDEARALALTEALDRRQPIRRSGGSVANSCVVASGLGVHTAFLGRIADDALGRAFAHDIGQADVAFSPHTFNAGASTARCLIVVDAEGQRTMNTFLGAAGLLSPDDIDAHAIARAEILYLEGYLFDTPSAQAAFRKAAGAGRRVALSLSDPFCVDRHRDAFSAFVRDHADIVFANETEIRSLYQEDDLARCADRLAAEVGLGAITLGAAGSLIVEGAERVEIPPAPAAVVDTTGAGDAYAAGLLASLIRGRPLAEAGRVASVVAAEVISHFGARPEADLRALTGFA